MKKIIFIYLFIYLLSCKTTTGYYHGYVLDKRNKPITKVKVSECNKIPLSTVTDTTGYFRLYMKPNSVSKLIFQKKGYQTDTVRTFHTFERRTFKRFLNSRSL